MWSLTVGRRKNSIIRMRQSHFYFIRCQHSANFDLTHLLNYRFWYSSQVLYKQLLKILEMACPNCQHMSQRPCQPEGCLWNFMFEFLKSLRTISWMLCCLKSRTHRDLLWAIYFRISPSFSWVVFCPKATFFFKSSINQSFLLVRRSSSRLNHVVILSISALTWSSPALILKSRLSLRLTSWPNLRW